MKAVGDLDLSETVVPPIVDRLISGKPLMAHLATCVDGNPHVAPIWYHYSEGELELLTSGKKLENIQNNPKVAVSIQNDIDGASQWMVTFLGTATITTDIRIIERAASRINRKYPTTTDDAESSSQNVLVTINIGSVSYKIY